VNAKIPPEKVLRGIALFCWWRWASRRSVVMKYPGYDTPYGSRFFDVDHVFFLRVCSVWTFFTGVRLDSEALKTHGSMRTSDFVQTFFGLCAVVVGLFRCGS